MCFYSEQKEPKIAEEDIIVYKNCKYQIFNDGIKLRALYIPNFFYSKVETAKFRPTKSLGGWRLSTGLHAWKDSCGSNTAWIVPKGAKYYEDSTEVCSNKLIFKEMLIWPKTKVYFEEPSFKKFLFKLKLYIKQNYD